MHQHDLPLLVRLPDILAEPCLLRFEQALMEVRCLFRLRVKHDEVRRAVVERVVAPRKLIAAVCGQCEFMQVRHRLADFPVLVVSLMIAHQGGHRDAIDDARDRIEPRLPLAVILAVVDEIPILMKKSAPSLRSAAPCARCFQSV